MTPEQAAHRKLSEFLADWGCGPDHDDVGERISRIASDLLETVKAGWVPGIIWNTAHLLPYSVLLLYPEHLNNTGTETYFEHTFAADAHEAVKIIQKMAAAANDTDYDNFEVLAIFKGHAELACRPGQL